MKRTIARSERHNKSITPAADVYDFLILSGRSFRFFSFLFCILFVFFVVAVCLLAVYDRKELNRIRQKQSFILSKNMRNEFQWLQIVVPILYMHLSFSVFLTASFFSV